MKFSPRLKVGIIVILLIIFLVVLNLTGFSKEVKNFFYLISSPIQKILWQVGDRVSDFFESISEIKNLNKENEELKLKIQSLMAENSYLKELKRENEFLRKSLNIGLEKEFQLTLVQVVGKDVSQEFLMIDKGLKDGLNTNLAVITQEKTLVGRISEVYDNFSKVMLISNKKSSFDGRIIESEIYGVIKGRGGNKINIEMLPQDQEIKEGDLVVTSAIGGIFPAGILVGKIEKVKKSDIEPFQTAEIKPSFDIKNLEFLLVIQR